MEVGIRLSPREVVHAALLSIPGIWIGDLKGKRVRRVGVDPAVQRKYSLVLDAYDSSIGSLVVKRLPRA